MIPGFGTFVFCLVLPLEVGILLGIGVNVVFILYHAARPKISVETLTVSIKLYFFYLKFTVNKVNLNVFFL